jgi:Domain of unknown function (DUF1648)
MSLAMTEGEVLYSDPLVEITNQQIRVKCYYLSGGDKIARWEDIEWIAALPPTLWNGKWRMWGTGSFTVWFACDFDRPLRQTIFIMKLRTQAVQVGFTVHDAARVKEIMRARGLLIDRQETTPPLRLLPAPRSIWQSTAIYILLGAFAATLADAIYYYPRLPGTVAIHFGASGVANDWGSKFLLTFATLGGSAIVATVFIVLAIAASRTAASVLGRSMIWFGVPLLLFVGAMTHLAYHANATGANSIGQTPWYLFGGFVVWIAAWLMRLFWKLSRV